MRTALLLASILGCSSAPPAAAVPTMTLSLSNATVRETAVAFASATGEPFVVTPDAERYADCVHLTLLVPTPRPVPEVASLLDGPLRAEGFALSRAATGWTLAHAGAPPAACTPLARAIDRSPIDRPPPADPPPPTGPVTETSVEVSRAEADGWRENQAELMRSARVLPHEEGGAVVGIRLYGIRPTSVLGRLGFQNGDTVYTVNGHSVASPDRMLEAYSALRDASEYRVDLSRRGERILHVIRVVD